MTDSPIVASLVAALVPPGLPLTEHTEEESRNLDVIREVRRARFEERSAFQAPGYTAHRRGMATLTRRAESAGSSGYGHGSIADREDQMLDMIAKGDRVWAVWMLRGMHAGELCGFPATGRLLEVLEVGIWRLVNGKIAEAWFFADELALLEQLGVADSANEPAHKGTPHRGLGTG